MTQLTKTADDFLAICPEPRRDRVRKALDLLISATEGADLFNVDYKEAKDCLGRAVEEAYELQVSKPYLRGKGWTPQAALDSELGLMSLHTVPSKLKKLDKLKADKPLGDWRVKDVDPEMVAAVRTVLDAAAPVAELVKELKAQVLKGRKPATSQPDPEALAKEAAKRTCPCCFRPMALDSQGLVVRHGWQEQGGRRCGSYGNVWHVGSCFGAGYAPYEVSCQGTRDYLVELRKVEAQMATGLATLQDRPAKLHGAYTKGYGRKAETIQFVLADDGGSLDSLTWQDKPGYNNPTGSYAYNLNLRIANAQSELNMLRADITTLERAIAEWKAAA